MRKQINISVNEATLARLELLLKGRTLYAYQLEALREKMTRDEGANK